MLRGVIGARSRRPELDATEFVEDCYRRMLGRPADPVGLEGYVQQLDAGVSPAEVVMSLATSEEYKRRIVSLDAKAVVDDCYRRILGRCADPIGLHNYVRQIEEGASPTDVAVSLATSEEFKQRIVKESASSRQQCPDGYRLAIDVSGTTAAWVFEVRDPSDFDWLEAMIIDDGYYEQAGVWGLEVDEDKRIMGELLASLGPRRALELGCSTGGVLAALLEHGIDAEGVEISRMARDHAPPSVRGRIHLGDLLTLALPSDYDLVFGLDVFEHLNPNRLAQYLAALHGRVRPGGLLYANIPAFGYDEVFGEVFPVYVAEWRDDVAANRPFRLLHCDDNGYPMNGHLIWAHTTWWIAQFEAAGFAREETLETELRERYAYHFDAAPARRSFYVFRATVHFRNHATDHREARDRRQAE
jgi:SAM-dependent methyltransferase